MDALYATWSQWRSAWYNPFRMSVRSLMTYLRDETVPVADRKAYFYQVHDWYIHEFAEQDYVYLQRLVHTSDHAPSTSYSYLYEDKV